MLVSWEMLKAISFSLAWVLKIAWTVSNTCPRRTVWGDCNRAVLFTERQGIVNHEQLMFGRQLGVRGVLRGGCDGLLKLWKPGALI
eukprot:scaffold297_cov171-Amphora_coffeaeformis.AAC.10